MGILRCVRKNCGNIMCDVYVASIDYICDECVKEFKQLQDDNGIKFEAEIKLELERFIPTDKNAFPLGDEISLDEFFDRNTRKNINNIKHLIEYYGVSEDLLTSFLCVDADIIYQENPPLDILEKVSDLFCIELSEIFNDNINIEIPIDFNNLNVNDMKDVSCFFKIAKNYTKINNLLK